MIEQEPTRVLSTGACVLEAVAGTLDDLHASGHVVIVLDGEVAISPRVHEDTLYLLQSNYQDTERVIEARGQEARRELAAAGVDLDGLEQRLYEALAPLVDE